MSLILLNVIAFLPYTYTVYEFVIPEGNVRLRLAAESFQKRLQLVCYLEPRMKYW